MKYIAPILLLLMLSNAHAIIIDFEVDGDGLGLSAGDVLTNQFNTLGISISATGGSNQAMVFDSANPTGGDRDLVTAGYHPTNDSPLSNILIISEDGDSSDPDDNAGGGTITFNFDLGVVMHSIGILDIDRGEGNGVELFDIDSLSLGYFAFSDLGDNSYQEILFGDMSGVALMEVSFSGSGAITEFEYSTSTIPEPSIVALMVAGLAGLGFAHRRRKLQA